MSVLFETSTPISTTYTTRLSLTSEQLEFLSVPELDVDFNCPFVVVLILLNTNFTRAANAWGNQYRNWM